jgi:hypothetical protein
MVLQEQWIAVIDDWAAVTYSITSSSNVRGMNGDSLSLLRSVGIEVLELPSVKPSLLFGQG